MGKARRKMRPQPPRWWTLDNDNCWFCKNRNNCGNCRLLKEQQAISNKQNQRNNYINYRDEENNTMADRQTKVIQWIINLPMDFPSDWNNDMIEFHLNESSWCCSNLISELEKYDEKNGCICGICEAKVADKIGGVE